jgi:hypothetical protein
LPKLFQDLRIVAFSSLKEKKMSKCDTESEDVERRMHAQIQEADAKRQKLEASIHAVDTAIKLLIDKAALRDIELHRLLHFPRGTLPALEN